jgi:hypothetical protein
LKLVILITARLERTLDIAEAWQQAGASGVTILEGYGLRRLQEQLGIRDDIPLMPSLATLLHQTEIGTHVLLSVVSDDLAGALYKVTVEILGDLRLPDNGFIFTLEVGNPVGLPYE